MSSQPDIYVLGSRNQAKGEAAKNLLLDLFGSEALLQCVDVEDILETSGVSSTPTSDDEGIKGALLRATIAEQKVPGCAGYIGLEGIISSNTYGAFLCGWAVVKMRDGNIGYGCSAKVRLPDQLVDGFDSSVRLSDITAAAYPDRAHLLPAIGTNGIVTNGVYTRVDEFTDALRCAFGSLQA
jgi:non-canonical (house-cleaning) NTP pyrophosphatase